MRSETIGGFYGDTELRQRVRPDHHPVSTAAVKDGRPALKLTIAQYLTPGEISIQGTGIVPDIALESVYIDEGEVYLTPVRGRKRLTSTGNCAP